MHRHCSPINGGSFEIQNSLELSTPAAAISLKTTTHHFNQWFHVAKWQAQWEPFSSFYHLHLCYFVSTPTRSLNCLSITFYHYFSSYYYSSLLHFDYFDVLGCRRTFHHSWPVRFALLLSRFPADSFKDSWLGCINVSSGVIHHWKTSKPGCSEILVMSLQRVWSI